MVDAQCKLMLDAYACLPNPVIHVTTVDQTVKLVYPYCYLFFGGGSGWVEPRRKKMLYNPLTNIIFSKLGEFTSIYQVQESNTRLRKRSNQKRRAKHVTQ